MSKVQDLVGVFLPARTWFTVSSLPAGENGCGRTFTAVFASQVFKEEVVIYVREALSGHVNK